MRRSTAWVGLVGVLGGCPGNDQPRLTMGDPSTDGMKVTSTGGPIDVTTGGLPPGDDSDGTASSGLQSTGSGSTVGDSASTGPEECGNGQVEGAETCDGDDLAGEDCQSLGFFGGALACAPDCTAFDTSACFDPTCGDGMAEGNEPCDGDDLAGEDCLSQGFDSGTLACASDCTLDTAGCGTCGNASIDGDETCDGNDLAGEDCLSQGFDSGELACGPGCSLDSIGCGQCGNGVVDGDELCDGMALGGQTCLSLGLPDGALGCTAQCDYDTVDCADLRLFFIEDSNPNGLYELSVLDGSIVPLGTSGVNSSTVGLAYNANTGVLLGSRPNELLAIQTDGSGFMSQGVVTTEGLAYDAATNTLYGALNGQFFTINPATGAILSNLAAPGYDMEALAFDPNTNTVYGIGDSTSLSAYSPAVGTWSTVGNTGLNWDSGGLAFDPNTNMLYAGAFAQGTGLYTIDPATAVPTLVGQNAAGVLLRGGLATAY